MKDSYTLLVLGNLCDNHLLRFTKYLKACNPNIRMDYFGFCDNPDSIPEENISCFGICNVYKTPSFFSNIPGIRSLLTIITWRLRFNKFIRNKKYDVANIHYITYHYYYIIGKLRKSVDKIVLTPWGSDIYRMKEFERKIVRKVYNKADYVTGHGDRFSEDFMRIYKIGNEKFKNATLGSETIDYIYDHIKSTSASEAKKNLGIEGCYAITCGYNASKAQRHKEMIESIVGIKEQLPEDLVLLFPLTYPKDAGYKEEIKKMVEHSGIKAMYYETYLDINTLFLLRQATDMFIHIQTTDANNASLKEYLLCRKKVVNGAWLNYYDVETDDYKPYYLVDNLSNLSYVILKAYKDDPIEIKESVIKSIRSMGCREVAKEWDKLFVSVINKK